MTGDRSARLLLLSCVTIWGWTFVATKICLAWLHPLEVVGLRFAIGLPLLLALVLLRRIPLTFSRGDVPALAGAGAVVTAHFLLQAVALRITSASNTAWIIAISPLAIAVLAFIFLGERAGPRLWAGIAAASAGVVVLVSRGRLTSLSWLENTGDWLVLLTAGTWALYTVLTRNVSRARDPLVVSLVLYTPLLVVCSAFMLLRSSPAALQALPGRAIAALLFLGVFGTLAQWFWQVGVARVGASRAGVYLYLEPVATMVLAVPLLAEPVGWFTAVGGGLILAGVWWAQLTKLARVSPAASGPEPVSPS